MAKIKVDEVLGLMCNKGAEIASYDAVPRRAFFFVKL